MTAPLRRLRELEQQATPGPWSYSSYPSGYADIDIESKSREGTLPLADAELIAAARNALPHLLAIAEAAERAVSARRVFEDEDDAGDGYEDGSFYAWQAAVDDLREAVAALDNADTE